MCFTNKCSHLLHLTKVVNQMKRISLVALITLLWLSAQANFVPYKSLGEPWMDSAVSEGIRKIGEAEFVRNYGMPNWVAGSNSAEFGSHYIVIDLGKWEPNLSNNTFYYERASDPSFYTSSSSPWKTWDSINGYNVRYGAQSDYIALYNIVLKNFPFPLKKDITKVKTDEGRNLFTQLQQIDAINDSGYAAQLYAFRTIVENICVGATSLLGYNGHPIVCYGTANLLGQFGNKPEMRASFGAYYVHYHNFNNPPTWLADLARIPQNLCPPITSLVKPSIEEKNFEIATAVQHFIECNAYGRCIMDGSVFGNMYARWLYDNLKNSTVISPTLLLSTCMKLNGLAPEFSWSVLTVGYETGHDEYNMTSLGPVYNSYTNASLEAISDYCDIMPRAQDAFKTDANIDRDSALYYGRMLYRIPTYMLEISTNQRVKLLDIITNSICWDIQGANDAADYRNHCEQICKSLYTYLPDGQEREFMGLLWEEHLLWDLSYRLDNTTSGFFGNDNYTDFIFTISSYWKEAYPEKSQPANGESVHYFVVKWESSYFNSNGRIVKNEASNTITVEQHQRINYTWYTAYVGSYNLDVYDPVTIHVAEGSFIPDLPGVKDLTVPAVFLDWLYHKKTLDDAATTAHVTLAVAALATGIGEFYQATSISIRVASALEVAISTSDLVVLNETVRNTVISAFPSEEDGRAFLQYYENITMMINFTVAAKGLISTFDYDCAQYVSKFDSRAAALRNTLGENSAEFRGLEKVRNEINLTSDATNAVANIVAQRTSFWNDWVNRCFPNRDWNTTTFRTSGIQYETFQNSHPSVNTQMRSLYQTEQAADNYLPGIINSGSTAPVRLVASDGDKFYKLVPKGSNINTPSPYYLSETEYQSIKNNVALIEQRLGLPLSSVNAEYDVFTITSLSDNNVVFESAIAPTEQFANATPNNLYTTTGGGHQTLIINNNNPNLWFKSPMPIETISPSTLPQTGN